MASSNHLHLAVDIIMPAPHQSIFLKSGCSSTSSVKALKAVYSILNYPSVIMWAHWGRLECIVHIAMRCCCSCQTVCRKRWDTVW